MKIVVLGLVCVIAACEPPASNCDVCAADSSCDPAGGCQCLAGFTGDGLADGTGCTDIDECASGTACVMGSGTCANTPGSFTCGCPAGYAGDGRVAGSGCSDVDECANQTDNCLRANGTCTNIGGGFVCGCAAGYSGDGVTNCNDVDECAAHTDNCVATIGTCTNTPGSFSCGCAAGYAGDGVTACNDIDECATGADNCLEAADHGTCTNTIGGFTCRCAPGYSGDGVTGCSDIDECAAHTDDCLTAANHGTCTNTSGGFACGCAAGYTGDGVTSCGDLDECATTMPCGYDRCENTSGAYVCRGMFASSSFQNRVWRLAPNTLDVLATMEPELPGFAVNGTTSIVTDPTTETTFATAKVSGVSGRVLVTVDVSTMTYAQVGNLGDNFSSLAFRDDGQLFGATGNGAAVPETLYAIDKATAVKTLITVMGNGVDGEVIAFKPGDPLVYHWSGNGTVVYESFSPVPGGYTPTNIPFSGATFGEVFGACWDSGAGDFVMFNISSRAQHVSTTGVVGPQVGAFPDDLRGPALAPTTTLPHTVTPGGGPPEGGTAIVLRSSGFSLLGVPTVKVGGVAATDVVVVSDTEIHATTPSSGAGPATITIDDDATFLHWKWPSGFTYFTSSGADAGIGAPTRLPFEAGTDDTAPSARGGCDAGGGTGSLVGVVFAAMALRRRRARARQPSPRGAAGHGMRIEQCARV